MSHELISMKSDPKTKENFGLDANTAKRVYLQKKKIKIYGSKNT